MEQTYTSKGQMHNHCGKLLQFNINIVLVFLLVFTYMEKSL